MDSVVKESLEPGESYLSQSSESTSTFVIELKFEVAIMVNWELLITGIRVLLRFKPSVESIKPNWKKLKRLSNDISKP